MQHRRRQGALLASLVLMAGSAVVARAVPADGLAGFGGVPGPSSSAGGVGQQPSMLLAQGFGQQGFTQTGVPGGGNQFAQGRQGGSFPGGGFFSLNPGQTIQQLAFCTDLLSAPPDETTRFSGGKGSLVELADGRTLTMASAISTGALEVSGTRQPVRTIGVSRLALTLALTNTTREPMRLELARGTAVTPEGQGEQPLPAGADRLFALATERRLTFSDTMQYAVWGARGSTAEEVEQANMRRLPASEIARVQDLLTQSGIDRDFDRNRGLAAVQFEDAVERLGAGATQVSGTTLLADGTRAAIQGVRDGNDSGFVRVKPARGGDFYYAAKYQEQGGRLSVQLAHLSNRHPLSGNGSRLVVSSAG